VASQISTAIPRRVDEAGRAYDVDVEDTVHALLTLEGGIPAVVSNSWATRVRRDDTMCVRSTARWARRVAGRRRCFSQSAVKHARGIRRRVAGNGFPEHWTEVPDTAPV